MRDFIELQRVVWAANAHDVGTPAVTWNVEYVGAIERALVMGDFVPLLALLDAGEALHPALLPALGDALRARGRPGREGRKPALTPTRARDVAAWIDTLRAKGKTEAEALAIAAADYGISETTARRVYRSHVPSYRRTRAKT